MPKLLQICVEGNTGSTGTIAEAIGQFVLNKGWQSCIAHGRFPRPSKSKLFRIGSDWDALVHGVETRIFDRHGLGSRRATKELIKQIEDYKPDIIHLHHLHGYYINIEIFFNYLSVKNIPVVWTFHDCWSFTGHCAYYSMAGCEKWQTECNDCPQSKIYPASIIVDRSYKNYYLKKHLFLSVNNLTIVAVSKWLQDQVNKSFLRDVPNQIIYNGININTFNSEPNKNNIKDKFGIGNKFLLLGIASPWSERKGFLDFLTLSRLIDNNTIIMLIGLKSNEINKLPKNIIGLTKTENQGELKEIYSAADLFLNFSVEESFGLTTAESLACGTPAIVYNNTACPEVVSSKTGFVINPHDLKAVIEIITAMKVAGKSGYSEACRERAITMFDQENKFKEYIELYKKKINWISVDGHPES